VSAGVDRHAEVLPRVSTFGSLRIRNYRLFATGQALSVVGNWMQNIAIGWLALQLSHSGVVLGIVTGARYLPILLFGPWGGLIGDRANNRRLLTFTQACLALISVVLAALSWGNLITLPVLIVIVVSLGIVNVFDGPSRQSLISQLVERRYLTNAIALNSTMMNMAKMIGPAVGGIMIATIGLTPCFWIDALSFGPVIASLLMINAAELFPPEREVRARGQIRAGLRYVTRTPQLLQPLLMVVVTGILTWEFPVSLPLLTTSAFHGDAATYGTAMAVMSVGAVGGGVVAARRRRLSVRSLAISALLWGALILGAAAAPALPAEFAILVFVGSASITFNSSAKTLLQLEAAPQMRARVMSLWAIAWQGGTVVGAPIVGGTAAIFGARYALVLGGAAAAFVGLVVLVAQIRGAAVEPARRAVELSEV
jgi:MFS family permease